MAWAFGMLLLGAVLGTVAANHPTIVPTCGGDGTCDDMALLQMHEGSDAAHEKYESKTAHRDDPVIQREAIIGKRCAGESYTDDEANGCAGFQFSNASACERVCLGQVQATGCPAKHCGAAVFYPDSQQCHLYEDCSTLEEFTQEEVLTYKIE